MNDVGRPRRGASTHARRASWVGCAIAAVAMQAHAADATLVREQATARDPRDGHVLYREQHWMRRDAAGRPLERLVLYRCAAPGTAAFARKRLDYRGDATAPRFVFEDARSGYREGLRAGTPPRLFVRGHRGETERTASLATTGAVVDAGFDEFVRTHWNALVAGRTLPLDFALPSRLRSYRFNVARTDDAGRGGIAAGLPSGNPAGMPPEPVLRLRLQLDGWLAWVAPHVDASYGLRSRRLLRFEGLGTIRDADGTRPLPARIDFEGAPTAADEAGWAAALATPLSGCAGGRGADTPVPRTDTRPTG